MTDKQKIWDSLLKVTVEIDVRIMFICLALIVAFSDVKVAVILFALASGVSVFSLWMLKKSLDDILDDKHKGDDWAGRWTVGILITQVLLVTVGLIVAVFSN